MSTSFSKELQNLLTAARETGVLKEANDKLENKVAELTSRLQFEKRLRTILEIAKAQDITELQEELHSMQIQVEEANARVVKEREAAQKAIKEALPVMVLDTTKIDALTAEVESLKASLVSEKHAAEEARRAFEDAEMRIVKKLQESEGKLDQLHDSVQRLEEKLSNSESEKQVIREQALTMSLAGKTTAIQNTPLVMTNLKEPECEEIPQKSFNEKQLENQDLQCISQDLGFSREHTIAACIIHKCLEYWRSFEVERTNVFDRIIQSVASAIKVDDSNEVLAYWLCNSSTLLVLLQHILKASEAARLTTQRRRESSASLCGRAIGGLGEYPAFSFNKQLTASVEKIYGIIRDRLKEEISPVLGLCIQVPVPQTSRSSLVKGGSRANTGVHEALFAHWQSIVKMLNNYLEIMKANYVFPFLVRKLFTQVFHNLNGLLLNSLLLQRECCSFSNGEFVKAGLDELEKWCTYYANEEYVGLAWDELKHIRQAVGFLVTHQKHTKTLDEIRDELCPVLSLQQIYRISTMYWDDKYGTHSVSEDLISSMRILMTEDTNHGGSFLLDDDSSIPFSVDDLSSSIQIANVYDVELPASIREDSRFAFLHQ